MVASFVVATAMPAAAQPGEASVVPTAGPVGTVVHLSGDIGPSCAAQAPKLSGVATEFLEFQRGTGYRQPNEWINVPVATDGTWSATFVIPSFVGGQAMTNGSLGGDVTPGVWQFGLPTCNGPAPQVNFEVTGTTPPASSFVGIAAPGGGQGYWLAQAGGGVYSYGDAPFLGSTYSEGLSGLSGPRPLAAPIVGITAAPSGKGYWLVGADGGVFAFGDAGFYGSLPGLGIIPAAPIVGITAAPSGKGYWLVGADGGVFAFGDAGFYGNVRDGVPRVALLASSNAQGYVLPSSTGIEEPESDSAASPLATPMPLAAPISGAAPALGGDGYWLVGADGGVFAFGDAGFYGSLPGLGITPAAPIVGITAAPSGKGYWLVGADGGVFAFGDAGFYGSGVPTRIISYRPFSTNGMIDASLHLQVIAEVGGTCQGAGVAGNSSYRCFAQPSGRIYDPCFARPNATSGPLLCPEDPANPQVVQFDLSSLPAGLEGAPEQRPWAVELSNGEVCVMINAAWGGIGPFGCLSTTPGLLADCHIPVQGTPWWTAACQLQETPNSPFKTYQVQVIWT
ncbi:MAG: hypothetical protein ACYCTL_13810 [Acidimicrobiales bacterium]